jgi:hypothetical protein
MDEALKVVLPVLAGLIVLFTVLRLVLGHFRRKFREEIRRKFAGKQIVRESVGANFFGRSSKGVGQIRGNGALVLTPQDLYFVMFAPRREVVIPLETVTSVTTPRSHLGKTIGSKLLRVDFRTPAGEDAAAWAVRDAESWAAAVRRYHP